MKGLFVIAVTALIAACAGQPAVEEGVWPGDVILLFSEKQPGAELPDNTRMLISENFLRIDNGPNSQDFILFDRKEATIYNVVAEDETIMVMPKGTQAPTPPAYKLEVQQEQSHALPRTLEGARAVHYQFSVDGRSCYDVVSVEILPQALQVLRDYRQTRASGIAGTYSMEREEDLCDLVFNVAEPTRHLAGGFPVREWGLNGYQRFLMDYQSGLKLPEDLFKVPAGYAQYGL